MRITDSHVVAVRDSLFGVHNIQRVLGMMAARHSTHDALLVVSCQLLSAEMCMAWTEDGFMPFRHMPQQIIPYTSMCKSQLSCILDALQHAVDMQLTQVCPKAGNGLCVYVASTTHAAVKAEPSFVLVALVRILRQTSCLHAISTDALCDRVLDKLHGSVCIARHRFVEAARILARDVQHEEKNMQHPCH